MSKLNVMSPKKLAINVAACSCLLGAGSAWALLEEVVVTAQKRSQTLQDVPISLSVVGGDMVEDFGMRDFADLGSQVPNFFVQDTPGNYAIYIRGMGSTAGNLAFEQTVGLFIDGVYAGKARQFQNPFLDIERIEVLRGPQGALVGKNTSAGAINVITRKPSSEFEALVSAGYEFEGETFNTLGTISGPLTDNLYGRLAASYAQTDKGFTKNTTLGGTEPEVEDSIIRGSLVWNATDALEVIAKVETGKSRIDGNRFETELNGRTPDYRRETTGFPGLGQRDFNDTDSKNATLTLNYTLNDFTITSITAYSAYDFEKLVDSDFTAAPLFGSTFAEDFSQVSQEFRLISPDSDKLEYAAGLYYHQNDYELAQSSSMRFGPFDGTSAREFEQDNEVWSLYGQATYHLSDTVRASISARHTEDEKEADQVRSITGILPPSWLATPLSGKRDEREFDASLNLQWDITFDTMVYATWSEGSKAGGFVGAQATTTQNSFEFEPEDAETYEVGIKTRLFDHTLMVNAAYFHTEYENLQVSNWDSDTSSFITGNAASATTEGVEVDFTWAVVDNFSIRGAVAYLDAYYDEFIGADCLWDNPGCDVTTNDIGGTRLPRTSRWNGTLNFILDQPISNGLKIQADLGLVYNSARQLIEDLHPQGEQDSFTKVNLRLALAEQNDKWSVALVGKNLTDETTFSHAFATPLAGPGSFTYLVDPPRTIAIQGEYRFY